MGKKLFIAFLSFSLLGLVVLGGFLSWLFSHPAALQSWIQRQTGLKVQAKSLQWDSVFPILRLHANQVVIESQPQQPVASIGQLSLSFNLPQLLLGKITLETVVLKKFQLEFGFSEEGNLQFGQWMLPTAGKEMGILSRFTLRVNRWLVSQGELDLHLPASWEMPTLQFSNILAHGKLEKGEVRLRAKLDWGGKIAKFAGEFEKIQERWQGTYEISQLPLHHFTIPPVPKVFPPMPVAGNLNLQGTLQESPTQWKSQAAWRVNQGTIKNPYFPQGHMPLLAFAGNLHVALDLEQGAHLKIDLQEAEIPPGNLQGEVRFELPFEAPPIMHVDVEAAGWEVNESKPYIFGFMPPLASDWIEAHIQDGIIEQAHFDLRWKMDFDYAHVNEVLHLNLQSELRGVQVEPFEKIPQVTDIHGHLHLGLWGLSVEVEEGRFPGSRLEGGVFSMGYGAPVRTPFQLEVYGEVESAETWPLVSALWEDKVPWLRELFFQGKAHVKFLLEDDDLLDDVPLSMEFQVLPRQVDVQWKTKHQTYEAQALQGRFVANLNELKWQDLAFTHASLKGKSEGAFSFVSQAPLKVDVHLDSLENWLPVHPKEAHPNWKPQSLAADLKLRQFFREGLPLLWQLDMTTTDDQQQNLTLQAQWENNQWKLPKITGKLGQLELEGFLDLPSQEGALQVESRDSAALKVELNWSQAAATLKAQASEFAWQDWLHWELPKEVWALLPPKESQAELLDFPLNKFQGTLAVEKFSLPGSPPKPLQTQLRFEKSSRRNNIFIEKFVLGSQQGQGQIQWEADRMSLALQGERFDVQPWLKMFRSQSVQTLLEADTPGGFAQIDVSLKAKKLHWSDSFAPEVALQTVIDLPNPAQNQPLAWTMQVQQFDWGLQKLQARLTYEKATLQLQMKGNQIQLEPWLEAMNNAPATGLPAPTATGLKQIQLDAQFESFQAFEQEIAQVSFRSTLDFPKNEETPFFKWEVQNFESRAAFVVPAQPEAFPDMPFSATFQFAGKGKFHAPTSGHSGQMNGQFRWKMNHGRLQNKLFPQQQMRVEMAGKGEFDLRPFTKSVRLHLTKAQLPFGTLTGQADFVVSPQERPLFALRLKAGSGSLEKTKPYLLGILPAVARPWMRSHLSGGQIEGADLDFRVAFAPDFSAVENVEKLDLKASLTGVDVRLLENNLAIENVGGQLHWGRAGGRLHIEQERFPKAALPLAEPTSGENPAARRSFQKEARHHKKATYDIEDLEGTILFNAEALAWESLHFKSGFLEVQGEGRFPFGQEAPKMRFRLRNLENFLPVHEGSRPESPHAFARWFPQKLSAVVEVEQLKKNAGIRKWHAHVVTTDEQNQHLEADVTWEGTAWQIQKLEGKLGQIATTSRHSAQENLLELKISPSRHKPIHVQFQWEGSQGRLALQTPTLRLQDWLGWKMPRAFKNWVAAESDSPMPSVNLEVRLAIEALELPQSPSVPLQTKFFFQQKKQGFLFVFHELTVDEQKAQGELHVLQDQISLRVRSERLPVRPWWNLLQGLRELPLGQAQPTIEALHLDFQTQHLDFSETFQPPFSLNMSLHFPPSGEEAFTAKLHRFDLFGTEGEGTLLLARQGKLDLRLHQTHFEQFLQEAFKLSAVPWLRTDLQSEAGGFWENLDFLLEAPAHEIRIAGRATLAAPNFQIDFQELKWEQQTGRLFLEQTDEEFNILGNFSYLDLQRWSNLRSDVQKMLAEDKGAKAHPQPQPQEFTLALPTKNWQVDVTVAEVKLLKTRLSQFVFQGRWGQEEIVIPKFVWKQNEKQAFSLAGNLKPQDEPTPVWRGAFGVEIAELGEVIELLFGTNSAAARQYPISGGQSHLQADVELLPAGAGRWKPQAQLLFKSREGIVERQESLTFLLAAFSLQSYAKVAQGKLSGFEGEGFVYNAIQSDMQLNGGRLEVKNFVFDSPAMRFVATGILDYETDEQDLLICLQPFETLDTILRNIPLLNLLLTSRRGSFLEGCYKSSGSLEDPSFVPLPQSILPGRLRDLLISGFSGLFQDQ